MASRRKWRPCRSLAAGRGVRAHAVLPRNSKPERRVCRAASGAIDCCDARRAGNARRFGNRLKIGRASPTWVRCDRAFRKTRMPPLEKALLASAEFRFYEELNDFLAPPRRKQAFVYAFSGTPSVKDAIEAIGVPHTEVDLVIIDG